MVDLLLVLYVKLGTHEQFELSMLTMLVRLNLSKYDEVRNFHENMFIK